VKLGQVIAGVVLGLALGLALGWRLFSSSGNATPSPPETSAVGGPRAAPIPSPVTAQAEPRRPVPRIATADASAGTADSGVPLPSLREALLQARVQELQTELKKRDKDAAQPGFEPLTPPANLPDRFKQATLVSAVQDAIHGINPKAEVTSVDCTEYPCIVYGTGLTVPQAQSLRDASALQQYAGDHGALGVAGDTFSVFFMPKDDSNPPDAVARRMSNRTTEMFIATQGH
jgi:hypothetical protein